MKISCFDKEVREILETGYYEVPRFQRPYSWEKENVEDFWNDTIVNGNSDYFIGSIVVYRMNESTKGIVDGQQRLTTITILLCEIRNALRKIGEKNLAEGLHKLIEKVDITNKPRFTIHTDSSYPYFQEFIQKFGSPDIPPQLGEEEELLRAASTQIRELVQSSIEAIQGDKSISSSQKRIKIIQKLSQIRDRLLGLKLIFIELDDEDDAYIAFETLNTRGLDLTAAHLVKNHLIRLLKARTTKVDLPKEKWAKLVQTLEESETELPLEQFLHHFWLSRYDYTTVKNLFKEIKKRIGKNEAKDFLDTLVSDSEIYRTIHEPEFRKWRKEERTRFPRTLDAFTLFRVKQPTPMILSIMRAYICGLLNLKTADEALKAIENFHFIFTAITSQRSSGGISFMYALHARGIVKSKHPNLIKEELTKLKSKLIDKLPSSPLFIESFSRLAYSEEYTKQKKLVQYILAKVCEHYSNGIVIDYDQMTIEHLAPQSPRSVNTISPSDMASIGNLILVEGKLNEKLANKSFKEKKEILLKSNVPLDPIIKNATNRTSHEIQKRAIFLAELGYKTIWRIRK